MTKFQLIIFVTTLTFCLTASDGIAQNQEDLHITESKHDPSCEDPQAINSPAFDFCEYPKTKKSFKKTTKLDDELNETSGLIFYNGFLWTHNDSGGEAALYKTNSKTGKIIQKITITNAKNTDWEDLAQDENYIYIGDFGNNYGARKDLKIYKVAKAKIDDNSLGIGAEVISFSYEDQTDFTKGKDNNFDCEAFFAYGGELHLFTKNWNDLKTRHYKIPTTAGDYKAKLIETFDAKGLITGADIDSNGVIILIGYTPKKLFMWICSNYENEKFFTGSNRRIEMGKFLFRGQLEGVCFSENGKGYISSERFKIIRQHLRCFSLKEWLYIRKLVQS